MFRSSAIVSEKLTDGLVLSRVAGILSLGLAVLLEAVVVTPFCSRPLAMATPLLLAAAVQIVSGLNEWRQDRSLPSVVLVSFGLFSCAQISQLGNTSTNATTQLAQGSFLLFWGLFAALVALQKSDSGRSFHLLLTAVATTLLLKAVVVVLSYSALWFLPLLAGVMAFALAILAALHYLPSLRS